MTILWSSQDAGEYVNISLYYDETYLFTIVSTENDGSYSWIVDEPSLTTIDSTIDDGSSSMIVIGKGGSLYRIKITSTTNQSIYDFSNYFGIGTRIMDHITEPYIVLSSPVSGHIMYQGDTFTLYWSSYAVGEWVKIELYKEGSSFLTIESSLYNSGKYYWVIPDGLPKNAHYQLKITSLLNSSEYDVSENFTIAPADEHPIVFTSPSAGDVWYAGESYWISWVFHFDPSQLKGCTFYLGSDYDQELTRDLPENGSYLWTVPEGCRPSSTCRFFISSVANTPQNLSNISGTSDFFTIDKRYILVDTPDNETTWYEGQTYNITYNSKNAGDYVGIELRKVEPQSSWGMIISFNTTNDGTFSWTIPSGFEGQNSDQQYRILIRSISVSTLSDISDSFTIDTPFLTLLSPTGGEKWIKGETHAIRWEAKSTGDLIDIELFRGGISYSSIAHNVTSDTMYYLWTIPDDLPSDSLYSIKIQSTSPGTIYEYSSSYLSIDSSLLSIWFMPIVFIIFCMILTLITIVVLLKRKHALIKNNEMQRTDNLSSSDIKTDQPIEKESISSEEYERIWENNRK